jgi:hypothetical protein
VNDLDYIDPDSQHTVFRDVIMLALLGFVVLVLLLLPHLNPKAVADAETKSPGNVVVEIRWPDEQDIDMDLWVQGPGDRPVGYSNQSGSLFNLLRDDLGSSKDITGLNYESAYSRGVEAGEYTVNVHMYRNSSNSYPVPVAVVVSVKPNSDQSMRELLATKVNLVNVGEELTALRFELTESGALVPGSVNDLPRSLRSTGSPAS